ncbi:NAD-dependent epimerase/dehydratase family protein [Rhodococcoides yunnanense]|uniref:NAD(P)-dependent oxidoreductase n=1 Tax=Rhodococcoides yunnanense TaxID=278209 RepID=A0ABU4BIB3_9NOCA|nr:NAD(P)-dependent oxidoreductase [Rhodococcus yunnanensis]MDV6263942.1 NAD(P)-dependent oxidoreductase [Rhodococcus yunnanensis]
MDPLRGADAANPAAARGAKATQPEPRSNVAVLGATGSIGRHVVEAFAREGHSVLAIARDRKQVAAGCKMVELDLLKVEGSEIAEIFAASDIRIVVNAAGCWPTAGDVDWHPDAELVDRLLSAVVQLPVRPRFIHIGTFHEYGPQSHGTMIDESYCPQPESSYARSKLAGSTAVLNASRSGQVQGVVVRSVNSFGPGVATRSFLGMVVRRLRELPCGGRLRLEVADAQRDFVDSRDLANAVLLLAKSPVVGRAVNIGRGEALHMRDLLEALVRLAGFPPDALELIDSQIVSYGGDWTQADAGLAERLVGWTPKISVKQSLKDMWEASSSSRFY